MFGFREPLSFLASNLPLSLPYSIASCKLQATALYCHLLAPPHKCEICVTIAQCATVVSEPLFLRWRPLFFRPIVRLLRSDTESVGSVLVLFFPTLNRALNRMHSAFMPRQGQR
jgi:hypothetical protein